MIRVKVKRVNTLKESKDKKKIKNVNSSKDNDKRVKEPFDKDIVGIPSDLKRLSKGIMEEDYDETIYLKIKEIERLNKQIELLKSQVLKLNKLKGKLKCPPKPTTDQLFHYCSKLADASKGKFDDPK
tara:strand:- start:891 stop:1271 length:381 start_codon:yes stop_codon:yes gene_type:complete